MPGSPHNKVKAHISNTQCSLHDQVLKATDTAKYLGVSTCISKAISCNDSNAALWEADWQMKFNVAN